MKHRELFVTLAFLLLLTTLPSASAQKPVADSRIKTALEEIGYKYELTDDNDYKLVPIQTEQSGNQSNGPPNYRSQLVYINSNTEKYGSLEIREVLAPAFLAEPPVSAEIANKLLRENNSTKLGAWRLVPINSGPNRGKYLAMYAAQINANSDAETLRLTIKSVILIADRMEKEVTSKDDY